MDTAYKVAYIAVFGTIKVLSYPFSSKEEGRTKTDNLKNKKSENARDDSKSLVSKPPVPAPVQTKSTTCVKIKYHRLSQKYSNKNKSFFRRRSTSCVRTLQTIPETEAVFNFQSRLRAQSLPGLISNRTAAAARASRTSQSYSKACQPPQSPGVLYIWERCCECLLTFLQMLQNSAARLVSQGSQLEWQTPTSVLLNRCGWLSIRQLIVFYDLLLLYKLKKNKKSVDFNDNVSKECSYSPRLSQTNGIRQMQQISHKNGILKIGEMEAEVSKSSFENTSINCWNNLPTDIRKIASLSGFKIKLKQWVKNNIKL